MAHNVQSLERNDLPFDILVHKPLVEDGACLTWFSTTVTQMISKISNTLKLKYLKMNE